MSTDIEFSVLFQCCICGYVVLWRAFKSEETNARTELPNHEESKAEEHAGNEPVRLPVQSPGQREKGKHVLYGISKTHVIDVLYCNRVYYTPIYIARSEIVCTLYNYLHTKE